jgi:hypothetical protein
MDHESGLTPAQEREARRKLRRIVGEGTPEEQAQRLIAKAFEKRTRSQVRSGLRKIGSTLADILFNALRGK